MIIDTLENASQYSLLNPLFEKAFEYLKDKNLDSLEVFPNSNVIIKILIFKFV